MAKKTTTAKAEAKAAKPGARHASGSTRARRGRFAQGAASASRAGTAASVRPQVRTTSEAKADRIAKATSAIGALLNDASPAELDRVIAGAKGPRQEDREAALWGRAPARPQATAAVLANLQKQFAGRRELERSSLSRAEAAELLGTSEQAVTDSLRAARLLGFRRGRRWIIPAWQFDPDAERGVLPGLAELARAFPGGVVTLSAWATRPTPDLDGQTPRDALAQGDIEPVLRLARTLTAAGW